MVIDLLPVVGSQIMDFEGVIDLTAFDEVVGVEILDFRRQLGTSSLPAYAGSDLPRWSYDQEADAFYLRLMNQVASVQRSIRGTAVMDETGRLTQLVIPQ